MPSFKRLTVNREEPGTGEAAIRSRNERPQQLETKSISLAEDEVESTSEDAAESLEGSNVPGLIETFVCRGSRKRTNRSEVAVVPNDGTKTLPKDKQNLIKKLGKDRGKMDWSNVNENTRRLVESDDIARGHSMAVADFNERIAEQQTAAIAKPDPFLDEDAERSPSNDRQRVKLPISNMVQNAFDRMRPERILPDVATITIGSKTTTSVLGSSSCMRTKRDTTQSATAVPKNHLGVTSGDEVSSSMRSFAAPESELSMAAGRVQTKSRNSMNYLAKSREGQILPDNVDHQSAASDEKYYHESSDENEPDVEDHSSNEGKDPVPRDIESDDDYVGEEEKKVQEEAKIAGLIRQAEENSLIISQDNRKRVHQILKGTGHRESTADLIQMIDASIEMIDTQLSMLTSAINADTAYATSRLGISAVADGPSAEERLSLTVSKSDFANMHISGQFNLGFVLATRNNADLFIIDQHASDEKYNFERLQENTVVQNQLLVQPRTLLLTAIEEEIILERNEALLKNGFLVDMDTSGDLPVGQRCKLISLPMSREVTFDVTDLEELIALLADSPGYALTENIPRPTKVRRMFAMRACRSSIMVGKTLTSKQMRSLVTRMGHIDKPWNCPHGRPTMRHLCRLDALTEWQEGDGLVGMEEVTEKVKWGSWHTHVIERQDETRGGELHGDAQSRKDSEVSDDKEDQKSDE